MVEDGLTRVREELKNQEPSGSVMVLLLFHQHSWEPLPQLSAPPAFLLLSSSLLSSRSSYLNLCLVPDEMLSAVQTSSSTFAPGSTIL